jgi:DNA-binding XRE family transcriptional regulator
MVINMDNGKTIHTITDYMNDDARVSPADRERIYFEAALIGKMIEAREEKGLSQRALAEISGVKQPAIARLENMKATPQIDTLFKVLHPLGYTIEIVPLNNKQPSTGV